MNLHSQYISGRPCSRAWAGFTLVEAVVTGAIFSLVIIGIVYSNLFGLRMLQITSGKLTTSGYARVALNQVRNDLRSAKILYVGNGDDVAFTRITGTALRQGNAVQIYPTIDTNAYVRYYLDTTSQQLKRIASGSTQAVVLASCITNSVPFATEDYTGTVLSTDQDNRVLKMYLEFFVAQGPSVRPGAGGAGDAFRLQTRVTRRAIE